MYGIVRWKKAAGLMTEKQGQLKACKHGQPSQRDRISCKLCLNTQRAVIRKKFVN
jgi:hypothetical protein